MSAQSSAADAGRAPPPRLVLDTHVWLDLLHFRDPRCAALASALQASRWQAVYRDDVLEEWRRVLGYPALALGAADRIRLGAAFAELAAALPMPADRAAMTAAPLPRCADPDDQKFLELAQQAGARLLLSRDRELLRLAPRMRRHHGIAVLAPEHPQAIRLLDHPDPRESSWN